MFETLSTIELTVAASIVVALLAHALARTSLSRLTVAGILGVWFELVLLIGASRALDPVAGLLSAFFAVPSIRSAMLATPLPALVAVNAIRVLPGALFVALYGAGRLPSPFAPSAGWGDIIAGVAALPLAWSIAARGSRMRALALVWNTIGIADLINAVALGALSSPGPLQVFVGPPTTVMMTTLPWLLVPGFIVPSLIFIHVVIYYRLATSEGFASARVWRGAGHVRPM
jgi:hypothetical protein